jgi:hypothetical protein
MQFGAVKFFVADVKGEWIETYSIFLLRHVEVTATVKPYGVVKVCNNHASFDMHGIRC